MRFPIASTADRRWFTRAAVADIICSRLTQLNLQYPTLAEAQQQEVAKAKEILENEA